MALTKFLILRKPLRGCLEERTALIQAIEKFFTASFAGKTGNYYCVFLNCSQNGDQSNPAHDPGASCNAGSRRAKCAV